MKQKTANFKSYLSKIQNITLANTIPPLIFTLLFLPSFGAIPFRDGNIDFVQSYDLYSGGFPHYLDTWHFVHPPLKLLMLFLLYHIGGITPYTYSLLGLFMGIVGIIFFYKINVFLFNKTVGIFSSLLLALSPLYLSNSIFAQTDFLVTVLQIIGFYFYVQKKHILTIVFFSLSVLTKETALVFPLIILFVEGFSKMPTFLKRTFLKKDFFFLWYFVPIIVFIFWVIYLELNNAHVWQDGEINHTNGGSFMRLLFAPLFNQYFIFNWLQLFILNFNWILWGIIFWAGLKLVLKMGMRKCFLFFRQDTIQSKSLIILLSFFIIYLFTVLNFPTFSIPRYGLPLIPCMLACISISIYYLFKTRYLQLLIFVCIIVIQAFSLFTSLDPISKSIWGYTLFYGQTLYNLSDNHAGSDGVTYNLQYQEIVIKRSSMIYQLKTSPSKKFCSLVLPDPYNDLPLIRILHLDTDLLSCFKNNGKR